MNDILHAPLLIDIPQLARVQKNLISKSKVPFPKWGNSTGGFISAQL